MEYVTESETYYPDELGNAKKKKTFLIVIIFLTILLTSSVFLTFKPQQ